jgi:hypothetical protein
MSAQGHRRVAHKAGRSVRAAALAVLAAALLSTALPAAAPADDLGLTVPGNQSAGDQYVETLPTTKGPRAPRGRKHAKKLSNGVTRKLQKQGGSDAATLEKLATSPALGAPVDDGADSKGKSSRTTGSQGRSKNGKQHGGSAPVPSAAINAVDGGEAGLGWLVLAILAITALSLGAVGYQRHRNKGSTE